jgi:hypothetical protein
MSTPRTHQVYEQFEHTPLWRVLADVLAELQASGEVTVATAPHYVLGYVCQELAAKGVVADGALAQDR